MKPVLPLLLIASVPGLAQAWNTFAAAYEDGLTAQQRGNHGLAIRAFRRAIELQPTPGQRVKTYGLNFLPQYYPYLKLAESQLAMGELMAAERTLKISESFQLEPAAERARLQGQLRDQARQRFQNRLEAVQGRQGLPQATPEPTREPMPEPKPEAKPVEVSAPAVMLPHPIAAQASAMPTALPSPTATPAVVPANLPQGAALEPARTPLPVSSNVPAPRRVHWSLLGLAGLVGVAGLGAGLLWRKRGGKASRPGLGLDLERILAGTENLEPAPVEDANLGRQCGDFVLSRLLGAGGCASTYYGRDRKSGAEAAIKIPHPHLMTDRNFIERFRREAALGVVLDHPRIVKTLALPPGDGTPWLALSYLKGITLQDLLTREGQLSVPTSVRIASDITEAIAHAHAKGVIHRDLKPSNVMIGLEGATVMDFGIARLSDATLTATSVFLGTPAYAAPEALVNPRVGPAADRYALGIMLFEMLAGQRPYAEITGLALLEAHRFEPLPDLMGLRPHVPAALWRLIQRLCDKAPEARPEDGEVLAQLKSLQEEFPVP